jgi:hypothetical protein
MISPPNSNATRLRAEQSLPPNIISRSADLTNAEIRLTNYCEKIQVFMDRFRGLGLEPSDRQFEFEYCW